MDKDRVSTDKEKNKVCVLVFSNENFGSGGGQVVSVLAFYSDDRSSNTAEVYHIFVKLYLKRKYARYRRNRQERYETETQTEREKGT